MNKRYFSPGVPTAYDRGVLMIVPIRLCFWGFPSIIHTARTVLSANSEIRVLFALHLSALYKIRGVFYTKMSVEKIIGVSPLGPSEGL